MEVKTLYTSPLLLKMQRGAEAKDGASSGSYKFGNALSGMRC